MQAQGKVFTYSITLFPFSLSAFSTTITVEDSDTVNSFKTDTVIGDLGFRCIEFTWGLGGGGGGDGLIPTKIEVRVSLIF